MNTRGGKFSRHGLVTSVAVSCCGCFPAAVDGRSEIVLTGLSSVALVHRRSSEATTNFRHLLHLTRLVRLSF